MKYKIETTIVDTSKALAKWGEESDWNGNNWISRATGSQWEHQTLYKSRKGNYYVEHESQWQGSLPYATWIEEADAARWLLTNGYELPEDLQEFEDSVTE